MIKEICDECGEKEFHQDLFKMWGLNGSSSMVGTVGKALGLRLRLRLWSAQRPGCQFRR